MELPKTFDSKSAEERWFQLWIDLGYFKADPERPGKVFSVVIPPPNVTGQLHLGHALNVTLQDIIVRTRRMQGYNTLWLPGTDHAGIATQNAVEKDLAKEGKNRHQLGRDAFVDRVWEWRETYGNRILNQLRRLGASCDWSRERFTLDAGLSHAVTKVFVDLYNKKLIYRAKRLINWCPRCETALSDLEVDHKDVQGSLWYIRYPLADGTGSITVATTRPETMLGDTAVAVNPDDERYKSYVGKTVRLPLIGREIPIIADAAVDREFGTGAVKVTPAHDLIDFELGKRHNLEQISIFDGTAHMNAERRRVSRAVARGCAQANRQGPRGRGPARKDRAAYARSRRVLAMRHRGRADALRAVVPERCARWPIARSRRCAKATRPSIRSSGRTPFSTGWRTSTTGASRASYGGAIAFPRIDACDATI